MAGFWIGYALVALIGSLMLSANSNDKDPLSRGFTSVCLAAVWPISGLCWLIGVFGKGD